MKDYWVDIKTPSRIITVKGKRVRTPTQFKIPEKELNALKVMLRYESVTDYKITEFASHLENSIISDDDLLVEDTEVIIENTFENEPKTTLEKLLRASEMEKKDEVDSSNN